MPDIPNKEIWILLKLATVAIGTAVRDSIRTNSELNLEIRFSIVTGFLIKQP
jgi:hypothetical protein